MGKILTKEEFIKKAKEVHKVINYDYSKVVYKNNKTPVIIIDPVFGEFEQTPMKHLAGQDCPKRRYLKISQKLSLNKEDFIEKAKEIHGNKYDYSKVKYINGKTKVCIICPIHGEFWQTPNSHLRGCGCPKCNKLSRIRYIEYLLRENNIDFVSEKTFDWLKYKKLLRLDIFISKYNIAIEHQGKQHFEPVYHWFKDKESAVHLLKLNQTRDKIKYDLCKKHNIEIFYINYNDNLENKIGQILNEIGKRDNK